MNQVRQPSCEGCPLDGQPKVFGDGSLNAEWLVVAEAPGPDEEAEGRPLIGPSGWIFESAGLGPAKLKRGDVRIENVNQCRAPADSPRGRRAQRHCGPSLHDIVRAMPNLRFIIAMGEPALEWISGWAQWELAAREARKDAKRWAAKAVTHAKRIAKYAERCAEHDAKVKVAEAAGKKARPKAPKVPAPLAERPAAPPVEVGFHTITNWRGSNLELTLEGRTFTLFPTMHPASVMAFRQPRLKPLFTMDFIKAARLARGETIVPQHETFEIRESTALEAFFADTPKGRIAFDLEWSRRANELACIALGRAERYALIPWRDIVEPSVREALRAVLQREFDDPEREWGGQFVSGFDERKLSEMGLRVKCSWDSLYGFHVAFAEIGSTRDETNPDLTQASGYDLGFIVSVLTPFAYHKFHWGDRDAHDIANEQLYPYCLQADHKVLMADLSYKALRDLRAGERIISFDEERQTRYHYKTGIVLSNQLVESSVLRVSLSDGSAFVVTPNHRWLCRDKAHALHWAETTNLKIGKTVVPRLFETWEADKSYEAGWLAGFLDGEGCIHRTSMGGLVLTFSQNTGPILDKAVRLVRHFGASACRVNRKSGRCAVVRITSRKKELAKFLGVVRPGRLLAKLKPEDFGTLWNDRQNDRVVTSIEVAGTAEIAVVATTTRTLIVDGAPHHNCVLDVRGCWYAMEAIDREFRARYGSAGEPGFALMRADMERTRLATAMGRQGVPIIESRRTRALAWLTTKLDGLEHEARLVVGDESFNPHSLPQLERYLEAQHIPLRARTETGRARLDKKAIAHLCEAHPDEPLLNVIGEIRGLQEREIAVYAGLAPTYDDRREISWKVHGTVGSRWSSNPNVQNLTALQKLIVGREGWKVVVADCDAAELRVAAVLAGQRDLVEQLGRGESPHLETAFELFKRQIDKRRDPEEYVFAKSTNYRWLYTLPDETLNLEGGQLRTYRVNISPEALARVTHWLNRRWPMLVRYKRDTIASVQATGFARSPHGRMRDLRWAVRSHVKKLKAHAARAAFNFRIQTTIGDQVGDAFVEAHPRIADLGGWIFANEHDSLAAIVPTEEAERAQVILREAIERPIAALGGYVIPASVKVGASWGEAT